MTVTTFDQRTGSKPLLMTDISSKTLLSANGYCEDEIELNHPKSTTFMLRLLGAIQTGFTLKTRASNAFLNYTYIQGILDRQFSGSMLI